MDKVNWVLSGVIALLVSMPVIIWVTRPPPAEPPRLREDGVLEFKEPRMGRFQCTSAGVLWGGEPTFQRCVIVDSAGK